MRHILIVLFFTFHFHPIKAQDTVVMQLLWKGQTIEPKDSIFKAANGSWLISKIRFYAYIQASAIDTLNSVSPTLVDMHQNNRLLPYSSQAAMQTLYIGVDSLLNAQGVHPGDLDPINGMYWSWQTGYIHFKLEGRFIPTVGKPQNVTYHIGGFNNSESGPFAKDLGLLEAHSVISIDLEPALRWALSQEIYQIMSPSAKGDHFGGLIASSISLAL